MPDDAIERARECLARTMEEFGGHARLSCAADIRRDVGNEYWDVPIRAMLAFASQQAPEGWERDFSGAPFDGTPILAAFGPATGNRVDIVFWQDGPKPYWRSAIMEHVQGAQYMRANQPIAWQHKPAPPAMLDAAPSVTLGEVG